MKFNFKIQPFQTKAVDNIVRVFNGQAKQDRISYRRDVGKFEKRSGRADARPWIDCQPPCYMVLYESACRRKPTGADLL
jgi:hypothetical protein